MHEIRIDRLPSCPGVSSLYKKAETKQELNAIVTNAKDDVCAYRISIDGKTAYESQGSGARKRWFKQHPYFNKL